MVMAVCFGISIAISFRLCTYLTLSSNGTNTFKPGSKILLYFPILSTTQAWKKLRRTYVTHYRLKGIHILDLNKKIREWRFKSYLLLWDKHHYGVHWGAMFPSYRSSLRKCSAKLVFSQNGFTLQQKNYILTF